MKKNILELLRELEELTEDYFLSIRFFDDLSGSVYYGYDNIIFHFNSEKELIEGLKNEIKKLKK